MLNKVLVAKFLTAMTLAGLATGAAAGFDGDDPADDGETIELETPFSDDDSTSSDDTTTEDESEEADDNEADEADEADDEAAEEEAEEDADESSDIAVEEPKEPTHGSIVSACARGTELTGKDKGQAVSAVAQDDTVPCAGLPEQTDGDDEAPAEEADEADADADVEEEKPRAAKAKGTDHRNDRATEKVAERDARKAGR